jgi:hypothetical protein
MEQIFRHGAREDKRIMIKKNDGWFIFYNYETHILYQNYIDTENERRLERNEEPLSEDEMQTDEIYSIPVYDWERDKTQRLDRPDNWHKHMKQKSWFTAEMDYFLNSNSGK